MLTLTVPARVSVLLIAMRTPVASPVCALLGSALMGCGCSGGGGAVLSAIFAGLVGLSGIGIASGFGTSTVCGAGAIGAGLGDSVARTLSWFVGCFGGSGMALTIVARMAPEVALALPQFCPECEIQAQPSRSAAAAAWSTIEPVNPPPSWSLLPAMLEPRVVVCFAMVASFYTDRSIVASYFAAFWDSTGWVTMLMLVMPARLTASITEANAPKGTFSSARR